MKTQQLIGSPWKWAFATLFVDLMRAIGGLAAIAAIFAGLAYLASRTP